MSPSSHDLNAYINFVLYAVYGKLAEADALMRDVGDSVRCVADVLAMRFPITTKPLYRGLLLDPAEGHSPNPNYRFLSWSEDVNVARWFGSRDSYISAPVVEAHPEARGYLLTLPAARRQMRVLFHHSWAHAFGSLTRLAVTHPLIGPEGAREIQWSVSTQREVITEPFAVMPELQTIESVDGMPMAELDKRLTPPWIGKDEPGFMLTFFGEQP